MPYNFKKTDDFYNPESIGSAAGYSYKAKRAEYQRLYSVARKRLKRFEESGLTYAPAYQINKGLKPASQLSDEQINYELKAVHDMLSARGGNVRGFRGLIDEHIKALKDNGIDFVNKKNYADFKAFMEEWRQSASENVYSSEEAIQAFGVAISRGVDSSKIAKNFQFYLDERKAIEQLPKGKKASGNQKAIAKMEKEHASETRRKIDQRIKNQAVARGMSPADLDTDYFRKNITQLEKMGAEYGQSARELKNAISAEKRKKTLEKKKRAEKRRK